MNARNTPPVKKPISYPKAIVFSCIPLILLLLIGEGSIRVWAYYFRTPYERYNYQTDRLELIPDTSLNLNGAIIQINSKGFVGPEFEREKPSEVFRIFALGDSCTFGTSWMTAYPALLQAELASRNLGKHFEVINAGIEGYNSTYALARLKEEVLQYDPDLVIVYVGWNDLMKSNPESQSDTGKFKWLALAMEQSYLVKAYKKLMFYYLRPLIMKPKVAGNDQEAHAFDNFVPATFKRNLEAMVTILRDHQVEVLFVTRPTVVTEGMTNEDIEKSHVLFPYYAGAYSLTQFLSLHNAYNQVTREAAKGLGVPLVDLDEMFNRYDKRDLFWDTMHPSDKGHRLIAQALADTIVQFRSARMLTNDAPLVSQSPRE